LFSNFSKCWLSSSCDMHGITSIYFVEKRLANELVFPSLCLSVCLSVCCSQTCRMTQYCGMRCHLLIFNSWTLSPVITLSLPIFWIVPVWMATTVYISFLFRLVLFRYVRVMAYVFCHTGVLVCLFVVTVADFWYDVMENQLSNPKLHYAFIVPHFWLLSFAGDPSISFQSHFCCSYFVYLFLFGIRLCWLLLWLVFVCRNGTKDFAKTGQVSDDTINLINY